MNQITHQYELDLNTFSIAKIRIKKRPRRELEVPGPDHDDDQGCLGICLGVCSSRADCPFLGCSASASGLEVAGPHPGH